MYIPLWCKSNYSFLEGASHPHELVEACEACGLDAMALTDRDGVYGIVRAWVKARELGIKLIVGSEITVDDGSTIVLLAQTRAGYAGLCRLISAGRLRCEKGTSEVSWDEVCAHADALIALWGGRRSRLAAEQGCDALADRLRQAFGDRLYAMVARHRVADEPVREARLVERAARFELALVAAQEVLYHTPDRRRLQDTVTCVRHGVPIHQAGTHIRPNAEHAIRPAHHFRRLFDDLPEAVARTGEVADRCQFRLDEIRYRYPSEALPDGRTSAQRLRDLTYAGARERYGQLVPTAVRAQLDHELGLISELDYDGYFLTMKEIVEFCRRHDILCQGRGSAADSAVCYCLGITAVDPVRMQLLFERFISRERNEPPDIDLDIEHARREEVIQHVYQRYGRDRAAMVANVIRYRAKSAVRDVGKALGLAETALDRLAKTLSRVDAIDAEILADAELDAQGRQLELLVELAGAILDFPRHLSIHPGGFLLGQEPVCDIVPIENGAMDDRTVIQWDKYDVEELGLFKVDLLGLGALTQLHKAFDLIAEHRGVELSMATLPADDTATYDMICEADTVGVFQIESRAQMNMLPRLRPRAYYDLVVEISLIRPGPITGEMVHPYLRRRQGLEPVTYAHPLLEPVLERTLGVPLFQEQVMQIATIVGDYTPGEADRLRRDMGMWRANERMERHRKKLLDRMLSKGIDREFAERIFEQLKGFASYGFPESHAASFALISYATSYLRCHYLAEFTCALLNSQPMGFYRPATIVEDARRHGLVIRPVDVLWSQWDCTIEPVAGEELAVRMGARYLKGMRREAWDRLAEARDERLFVDLDDLVRRAELGEADLDRLAEAGALESLERDRRQALWRTKGIVRTPELPLAPPEADSPADLPRLTGRQTIAWDYRTTYHSPRGHPLEALRHKIRAKGLPTAAELGQVANGRRVSYAGMVICRQRPSTASGTIFMTLEDETGWVNVILWPAVYERFRLLARTQQFLGVSGQMQVEGQVAHLIADMLWQPDVDGDPASGGSRDFR